MARRRNSDHGDLGELLWLIGLLVAGTVWAKTMSVWLGLLTMLVVGVVPIGVIWYLNYRRLQRSGIEDADRMSGEEFERFLLAKLRMAGYRGQQTRRTGDYGADLVVTKNGVKTVVQAKRYKQAVGIQAVQEIIGAVRFYDADGGWVITNSRFSSPARRLAEVNGIELWDREALIGFLYQQACASDR